MYSSSSPLIDTWASTDNVFLLIINFTELRIVMIEILTNDMLYVFFVIFVDHDIKKKLTVKSKSSLLCSLSSLIKETRVKLKYFSRLKFVFAFFK